MSHKAEDIWSPRESYHNHELVSSLSARIFRIGLSSFTSARASRLQDTVKILLRECCSRRCWLMTIRMEIEYE